MFTPKKKDAMITGLEIEAGSIAATEVRLNGGPTVTGSAVAPLAAGAVREGEVADRDALSEGLRSMWAENKLSRRVRLGVANPRLVFRTMRLPAIEDPEELAAAVRFQAQDELPMPLDQAVLDHHVVGGAAAIDGGKPQIQVAVVAARKDMISSYVDPLRRAGLQPVGVDLSAFGMIRALAANGNVETGPAADQGPDGEPQAQNGGVGAVLYCHIGEITNLAVANGRSCLFTRSSASGLGHPAESLAAKRGLTTEHSRQWLAHVGLGEPVEGIEGDASLVNDAREALEEGASALAGELRLSLDYYGAQEDASPVESVVVCGPGSAIQGLPELLQDVLGVPLGIGRPPALSGLGDDASARLTVSYGLALEQ
jgi:type IV pilus assembly protein PilM